MIAITAVEVGVLLSIYVQPGAKQNKIVGEHAERLKIAVSQIAEGGKANQAVIDLLADAWGIGKNQIEIIRGHTSRQKTICIHGVTLDQIRGLLPQTQDR